MKNSKTEDSQHRARWWSGWEEEGEGKKERKEEIETTRGPGSTRVESYFAECYCLINSKMAAPLVRLKSGTVPRTGRNNEVPRKKGNQPSRLIIEPPRCYFYWLLLPVYVRKLFSSLFYFSFSFHACFVAPHVYFQLMKLRFKKRVSIPTKVRRTRLHKWIIIK